jgi:23S rRNA G2445 N2-methylase RlmL
MENSYFASCSQGVENILQREITSIIGISGEVHKGGVSFDSSEKEALKTLLYSRTASRLFRLFFSFDFNTPEELYRKSKEYPWNKTLSINQTFKIQVLFDRKAKEDLGNSIFISQKIKDALVDQYREKAGGRPSVDKKSPDFPLMVRVEDSESDKALYNAKIYVDLCQVPLSNRGYRMPGHRAPLRENLAAALILHSNWSYNREPLCDLFSGSGTILIEAALIKAKVAPTYLKLQKRDLAESFAFMNQKWFQKNQELKNYFFEERKKILNQTKKLALILKQGFIYGVERDSTYLELIKETILEAGLPLKSFSLSNADALTFCPPEKRKGVIISNPPYGERLNEDTMKELYYELGENLKNNWNGWRAHLLTSNNELRKAISLRTEERLPIRNGNLECRLLKYSLF